MPSVLCATPVGHAHNVLKPALRLGIEDEGYVVTCHLSRSTPEYTFFFHPILDMTCTLQVMTVVRVVPSETHWLGTSVAERGAPLGVTKRFSFKLRLWRSDMITSVLELDSSGIVVETEHYLDKLYPAGAHIHFMFRNARPEVHVSWPGVRASLSETVLQSS